MTPYLKKLVFLTSFLIFPVVHAGEIEDGIQSFEKGEYEKAIVLFASNEAQENPEVQYRLGLAHLNGWGEVEKSAYVASLWFEKSASQNHIPAQYELGILYSKERHNFGRDLEKSHYWMELAAKNGDPNAQYETGKWYEKKYLRTDIELGKAIKWYRLAAGNGQSDAQGKLAGFHETGTGIEINAKLARYWANKSAGQNNPRGLALLGRYLTEGIGGTTDIERGLELIHHAASAGDSEAQFQLAEYYRNGRFIGQNDKEALNWYEQSASKDYLPAMKAMAEICQFGLLGRSVDKEKASLWRYSIDRIEALASRHQQAENIENETNDSITRYWPFFPPVFWLTVCLFYAFRNHQRLYQERLMKGGVNQFRKKQYGMANFFLSQNESAMDDDPDARAAWGEMLVKGLGVDKNVSKALYNLVKASEYNGRAAYLLGSFYDKGEGLPKKMENAIYWYEKGAALYDINACNRLAILYATGNGVKKNETKAFELLFTSADQGYPDAGYNIAMACHFGQGTIRNDSEAFKWLEKSASANHKLAALALADIHEYGLLGKRVNYIKAQYWREKANAIRTIPDPDNLLYTNPILTMTEPTS